MVIYLAKLSANASICKVNFGICISFSLFTELDEGAKPDVAGGYHNVAFSYGNTDDSTDQKNPDDGLGDLGFRPPFPVPESLLQSLVSEYFSILYYAVHSTGTII